VLELAGEPPFALDLAGEDPDRRAALVRADGHDRALVALSSALGIEALPRDEAAPLLAAYAEGVVALPAVFGAWAAVALDGASAADVDAALDAGGDARPGGGAAGATGADGPGRVAGLCLPASALATPAALDAAGPLLEALERRGAPLFVHPGPATAHPPGAPAWWPALTTYLAELVAAWHAFAARGRAAHPRLRVAFAALAGGAPLHLERLAARAGPELAAAAGADGAVFYDTSSYGPHAVRAVAGAVGWRQLVFGSDRPYAIPADAGTLAPGPGERVAVARTGPARLLGVPA